MPRCADTAAKSIQETRGWENCFGRLHIEKGKFKGWTYIGEFKNDNFHGQGTLYVNNEEKYEGTWNYGELRQEATISYPLLDRYKGEWKNDREEGKGSSIYVLGEGAESRWKNNKMEEGDSLYDSDSVEYEGEWMNNKVAEPVSSNGSDPDEYLDAWSMPACLIKCACAILDVKYSIPSAKPLISVGL